MAFQRHYSRLLLWIPRPIRGKVSCHDLAQEASHGRILPATSAEALPRNDSNGRLQVLQTRHNRPPDLPVLRAIHHVL